MQTFLFVVSKVLRPILASPFFIGLAVAAAALIVARPPEGAKARGRRIVRAAGLAALGMMAFFSLPVVARALTRAWEVPLGDSRALAAAGPFDAIVVLGGCVDVRNSSGEHLELNAAAERTTGAALLYHAGIAPRVLATSGSGVLSYPEDKEAPLLAAMLERLGVPAVAIMQEDESRNTFENAVFSRKPLEEVGAARIVLVTSAWHMRRSAAIFKKAGYDFLPYAVDTRAEHFGFPADYLPDASALDASTRIVREAIGVAAYRLLGRL